MTYEVIITDPAFALIAQQTRYVAIDQNAPINAARWLDRILKAADSLEQSPRRCAYAPENDYRSYEIRKVNVGGYLLLFTIVDETETVWVIGFRHGRQLPRLSDLPDETPSE